MGSVTVWSLILYLATAQAGGPTVIDNIVSKAECEKVGRDIKKLSGPEWMTGKPEFQCVEVKKAVIK